MHQGIKSIPLIPLELEMHGLEHFLYMLSMNEVTHEK